MRFQFQSIYVTFRIKWDNIKIIDIKPIHAIDAGSLPLHHKDPFDRMIITQATIENLTIVTSDTVFQKYDVAVLF